MELAEDSLGRIASLNPELGAFVEVFARRGLRHAAAVDRRVARGQTQGAFLGVPYAIKDLDAVRFARLQAGSRHFRYAWSPVDAPQVSRQRDSGVVLVGKTATSEFGLLPTVEPDLHPPARNPWNPAFLSGGSSGGAATAVASGMLALAQGSDGGGSIRIPAALCHLFGWCSRDHTPYYGKLDAFGLAVIGALTHTIDDAAAMLDALCGKPEAGQSGSLLAQSRQPAPAELRIKLMLTLPSRLWSLTSERGCCGWRGCSKSWATTSRPVASPSGSLDEFLPIYQRFAAGLPVLHAGWLRPATRWLREEGPRWTRPWRKRGSPTSSGCWWVCSETQTDAEPQTPCFAPRVGQYAGLSGGGTSGRRHGSVRSRRSSTALDSPPPACPWDSADRTACPSAHSSPATTGRTPGCCITGSLSRCCPGASGARR